MDFLLGAFLGWLFGKKMGGLPGGLPGNLPGGIPPIPGKQPPGGQQPFPFPWPTIPASWQPPWVPPVPTDKPPPPDGGGGPPPPTWTVPPQPSTYTIKSGDFPSGLAQKRTGDAGRWRELLKANPDMTTYTDQKGQTQIKPWKVGQVILLPPGW